MSEKEPFEINRGFTPKQAGENIKLIRSLLEAMNIPHILLVGYQVEPGTTKVAVACKVQGQREELESMLMGMFANHPGHYELIKDAVTTASEDEELMKAVKRNSTIIERKEREREDNDD